MSDLYFGYGSNLNVEDWKDFAKRENLNSDSIKAIPGILFGKVLANFSIDIFPTKSNLATIFLT